MQIKMTIVAILAVAMLAAGCGGGDLSANEQSNLATREDAARAYSYEVDYYDGPDYANVVGTTYYNCSGPGQTYGTVTEYSVETGHQKCSYSGYECPPSTPVCF